MNLKQAEKLLDSVIWDLGPGSAKLRQLGNGEWFVVISRGCFWLWNESDYPKYLSTRDGQELLQKNRASLASFREQKIAV
jgi:hypothetical protein